MSHIEHANDTVNDAIERLNGLLERKTAFGEWDDECAEIVASIAKLRSSMNPTIVNNNYGAHS